MENAKSALHLSKLYIFKVHLNIILHFIRKALLSFFSVII
jgi:hypothetical protein